MAAEPIRTTGWCQGCSAERMLQLTKVIWTAKGQAHSWSCTQCGTTGWHQGPPMIGGQNPMESKSKAKELQAKDNLRQELAGKFVADSARVEGNPSIDLHTGVVTGQVLHYNGKSTELVSLPKKQLQQLQALVERAANPVVTFEPEYKRMLANALRYSRMHSESAAALIRKWLND